MSRRPVPHEAETRALQERLGRRFRRRALLDEALTHASAHEGRGKAIDNERMEFFGDRVLGLIVSEWLYKAFPDENESGLAARFNALVNRAACARAARRAELGQALVLSRSERDVGGRDKDTILADACEALVAALYLDGGLKAARSFVERYWAEEFEAVAERPRDPKTTLQEWAAAGRRGGPRYTIVERTGPDHAPRFTVEACVNGLNAGRGCGRSKREAEQAAALALLKQAGLDV